MTILPSLQKLILLFEMSEIYEVLKKLPIIGHWKKTPVVANGPGTSALVLISSEWVNVSLF